MALTEEQFQRIEHLFPTPRGNCKIDARTVLNAYLHILKEGCTWRGLPTRYGRWHTVYMRWSRWSKKGVWVKVFKGLQDMGMMPSGTAVGGLDSTSVPVHKHAAGAPEKTAGKRSDGRAAA